MPLLTVVVNDMLDDLDTQAPYLSIHTADPGGTGADEGVGGSYFRQLLTWNPASGGTKSAAAAIFQIPAGTTITHCGVWSAASGGSFRGGAPLPSAVAFPVAGPYSLSVSAAADPEDLGGVAETRLLTAGTGLTGGGTLEADRTFAVAYGTSAGTATEGNDTRVAHAVSDQGGSTITAGATGTHSLTITALAAQTGNLLRLRDVTPTDKVLVNAAGNVLFGGNAQFAATSFVFNTGTGVVGLANATVVPSNNPSGGVVYYSESGVLKVRDPGGAIAIVSGTATARRTDLGLGGAALLAVGTTAGTVAAGDDSRITGAFPASGGTVSGNLDVSGQTLGMVAPRSNGLIAWTYDPALATNGAAVTNGTVYLMKVEVPRSLTATSIKWGLNSAGVTATAASNWVGLYNSSGTRLATVDVTAKVTSATLQSETISVAVTPGFYWIAFVFNASTPPQPYRAGGLDSSLLNVGLTAATARYATNGTVQTTLPSSVTPASNTNNNIAWWAALG